MLVELNIKNFAIIDDLSVEFSKGLNVLTGETGSGKSILIDALDMILGGRANKSYIRTGCSSAFVQGVFFNQEAGLQKSLERNGLAQEDYLTISREIFLDRPSLLRVNGQVISLNQLKEITGQLVDIFAQHDGPALLDSHKQKFILDSFGDKAHSHHLEDLARTYETYQTLKKDLDKLTMDDQSRMREIDLLDFQCQEIQEAQLTQEDEEDLVQDYKKLENQESIREGLEQSLQSLQSSYESVSALDQMDTALASLYKISDYDEEIKVWADQLQSLRHEVHEVGQGLNRLLENSDQDPEALRLVEDRLNLVNNLKRKYGDSVQEILAYYEESQARLELLKNYKEEVNKKHKDLEEAHKKLQDLAQVVHKDRETLAQALEKRVEDEISQLNLKDARFKVHLEEKDLGPDGMDQVVFYLSTNLGEDLKPLSQVASGGEMSRMMLGFKSIIADRDHIMTLVFDEIDAGISGQTAHIVGKKLKALAQGRQVLVISHLPQMVALAQTHYRIEKTLKDGKMVSNIRKSSPQDQAYELARLISSGEINESTLETARSMIKKSREDL